MDQFRRKAILLGMINSLKVKGSWCGETHIQKAMFSLKNITGTPIDYTFVLYKHGAFSFDLRDELTDMRADNLLTIEINPSPYGPSLAVSDAGLKYYEKYHDNVRQYDPAIDFITQNLGTKGVAELERISTALYVCREEDIHDIEKCAARVHALKPHVPIESARDAATDVDRMLAEYQEGSA